MIFYRLIIFAFSPIIIGQILLLSIKNKQSRYFWQRLGFKYSDLPTNCLWFHCASVGEVNTLLPLLNNIHKKNHHLKMIITTNTITGGKIVAQRNLDYLHHCYLPFDWTYSIKNFLTTTKPISIHIMETEIWPNLFTSCHRNNIPIYIVNARLSSKTTSAKQWVKKLYRTCLLMVEAIYARSVKDAEAYKLLGANEDTITTIGNLKFSTAITNDETETTTIIDRKYVLVASTHKDEEAQIYTIWKKLRRSELLIIAPRHPERSASIIKQINSHSVAIRSKNQQITDQTEIFLLDTVGELKNYFKNAELVIMGGSFTPVGGHNILEPASFKKAIITGPYMENFSEELALLLKKNAIVQITSKLQAYSQLQQQIKKILEDDGYRKRLQENTRSLSHNAEKTLDDYANIILESSHTAS